MKAVRAAGFTLIELLTVIAIISILAGLTAVVIPRVLEKAKVTDAVTDMAQIATALQGYYTENGTYPPGYGYEIFQPNAGINDPIYFYHRSYTDYLGITDAVKQYDRFSEDYDTNGNTSLQLLEFLPLPGSVWYGLTSDQTPYDGTQTVDDAPDKLSSSERPYIYIPYAKKDVDRMRRLDPNWNGQTWNNDFIRATNIVPPPQYDAFILMSVGPLNNTRGLISPPGGNESAWLNATDEAPQDHYYMLAMRAAYLALVDGNDDGRLDLDYVARRDTRWVPQMPDLEIDLGYAAPIIIPSQ
ncbi:MAG: type II secretion system protein [Candidatus Hydrogenedentes bacterium]|nr:type II secretion system protein [Candidatus Hydrogenedentota bacterium]